MEFYLVFFVGTLFTLMHPKGRQHPKDADRMGNSERVSEHIVTSQ